MGFESDMLDRKGWFIECKLCSVLLFKVHFSKQVQMTNVMLEFIALWKLNTSYIINRLRMNVGTYVSGRVNSSRKYAQLPTLFFPVRRYFLLHYSKIFSKSIRNDLRQLMASACRASNKQTTAERKRRTEEACSKLDLRVKIWALYGVDIKSQRETCC